MRMYRKEMTAMQFIKLWKLSFSPRIQKKLSDMETQIDIDARKTMIYS